MYNEIIKFNESVVVANDFAEFYRNGGKITYCPTRHAQNTTTFTGRKLPNRQIRYNVANVRHNVDLANDRGSSWGTHTVIRTNQSQIIPSCVYKNAA
jgi:hypothetical protein